MTKAYAFMLLRMIPTVCMSAQLVSVGPYIHIQQAYLAMGTVLVGSSMFAARARRIRKLIFSCLKRVKAKE